MILLLQKQSRAILIPGETSLLQPSPIPPEQQHEQPTTYRPLSPYLHLHNQQQSVLPPVQPLIAHRSDEGGLLYQQQRAQLAQQLAARRGLVPNYQQQYVPQVQQQVIQQIPTQYYQVQRSDNGYNQYSPQIYQQQYHEQRAYNQLLNQQRLFEEQQLRERLNRNYNRFDLTPNNPAALFG